MIPGVRKTLALPLLVLVLVQLQLALAALLCARDPLDPTTYSRRDSTKYLKIAKFGYFEDPDNPKAGDAGWLPGYPLLIRAGAAATGARPVAVGRIAAVVFHLGLLAVLGHLLAPLDRTRRLLALLLAGFFPGAVYYEAVFPVSMFLFFLLLAVALCNRGRFLAAGLCGALAAFTYSTGFVVAAALAIGVLHRRERASAWVQAPIGSLIGLLAVLGYQQLALGRWDAFFAFQREFGHTLTNPLATLGTHVGRLVSDPHLPSRLIGLQTLVVAVLMAVAVATWWRERASGASLEAMLAGSAVLFWMLPLLLGPTVSPYRAEALLVGITPLLGRLPIAVLLCLLVVLVALSGGMSVLFFDDVLV